MGADLYMEKSYKQRMQKHNEELNLLKESNNQEEVLKLLNYLHDQDVYFRDSYNAGNTLWAMGLSWWTDISPMTDSQGILEEKGIKTFLNMIEKTPLNVNDDFLKEIPSEWTPFDAKEYLKTNRSSLINFLKQSLLKGERIICSI